MEGSHKEVEQNDEKMVEGINHVDTPPNVEEAQYSTQEDSKDVDLCSEYQMPSPKQEEEAMQKKYGGLLKKKPPLISKDNERAFFDSADWALGKVGAQKSKNPLEALRPKLQPTPHRHSRSRSGSGLANDGEDGINFDELSTNAENHDSALGSSSESHNHSPEKQNLQN